MSIFSWAASAQRLLIRLTSRYPVSKLVEIYAGRELASLLPAEKTGVVINLLCPGLCWSELTRNCTWGVWLQIFTLRLLLARSQEVGSRTLLHAAVAGPDSHGQVCSDCEIRE